MEGTWVECDIFENVDYDFCFYAVDQSTIYKDDIPLPQPGEIVLLWDNIIPNIAMRIKDLPYKKKAILVYNKQKKWEQEE